jgi:hypothetical protein
MQLNYMFLLVVLPVHMARAWGRRRQAGQTCEQAEKQRMAVSSGKSQFPGPLPSETIQDPPALHTHRGFKAKAGSLAHSTSLLHSTAALRFCCC